MASTEKVSLSLDAGALILARRAAEIEDLSLSAYLSRMIKRHAWESERPRLDSDARARADQETAELDEHEARLWRGDGGQRAAG